MINMWISIFFISLNLFEERKPFKKLYHCIVYYGVYNVYICVKYMITIAQEWIGVEQYC